MKKMKFQKKQKPFKKCPRCGNKCLINQEKCEECGLVFSKLQFASNRAAKKKLLHFDRDYVIFTNRLPADVSKVNFYYVGKYIKGLLMSLGFVYLIVGTIFNEQIVAANATLLYIPISIYALSWIVTFSCLLSKRFKVPIYFDESLLQAEKDSAREEYGRVSQEIKQENDKLKRNKKNDKKNVAGGKTLMENSDASTDSNKERASLAQNSNETEKAAQNKHKKAHNKTKNTKVGDKKLEWWLEFLAEWTAVWRHGF